MDPCRLCRLDDRIAGSADPGIGNVVRNAFVEKKNFLRKHGECPVVRIERETLYVCRVDRYVSIRWIVEPHEQVHEGAFAAAVLTGKNGDLPFPDGETYVSKRCSTLHFFFHRSVFYTGRVTEGSPLELDLRT